MDQTRREFLKRAAFAGANTGIMLRAARFGFASQGSLPMMNNRPMSPPTIAGTAAQLRDGKLSPVEITKACLERIERLNPQLNAFITRTAESAMEQASAAEKEIHSGHWRGPLHGIPIALKDIVDTAGVRTTAASALFKDRVPTADADV